MRRYLRRSDAHDRRIAQTLRYKQDPAEAGGVLANPKARAAGPLKIYYLGECGFVTTPKPTGSWTLPGQRKPVDYDPPRAAVSTIARDRRSWLGARGPAGAGG